MVSSSKRTVRVPALSISSYLIILLVISSSFRALAQSDDDQGSSCEARASGGCYDKAKSTKLKIIGIFTILVASMLGIGMPLFSTALPFLHPDRKPAVVVKILASGVILSTGFMHVLPDSWNNLTSECLSENPWRAYPMSTLIAMFTCVLTMMMDTIATSYFRQKGIKSRLSHCHHGAIGGGVVHHMESPATGEGMEMVDPSGVKVGHGGDSEDKESQLLRYRIVAQV